jgi:hypothetical protein
MIEMIRLVDSIRADATPRRVFYNLVDPQTKKHDYLKMDDILQSPTLRLQMVKSAERDLQMFQNRYDEILEVAGLISAARERLAEARERLEAEARGATP